MDTNSSTSLRALTDYLAHVAPDELTNTVEVERLLASAWDDLVRDDGGMESYKLFNRMEDVTWTPPLLTFRIERHGGTVMRSSRAEMQTWTIDVDKGTASCEAKGYRQLSPRQPPLDVKPLVEEIACLILKHVEEARLKWLGDGTVMVKIGLILPEKSAVKETLARRRKRFRVALAERLAPHGWVQVRANRYQIKEVLG